MSKTRAKHKPTATPHHNKVLICINIGKERWNEDKLNV